MAGTFFHVNVEFNAGWDDVEGFSQCRDTFTSERIAVPASGVQGTQLFQGEVGYVACAIGGPIDVRVMHYDDLFVSTEPEIELDHFTTKHDGLTKGSACVFGMSPGGATMGADLDFVQRRVT
jgi:hypothetical protein